MTMFPTQNLSKNQTHGGYGGGCGGACYSEPNFGHMSRIEQGYYCNNEACLGSDIINHPMAEDESRTESTTVNEGGGASSSKGVQDERERDHDGWLQLGIGAHTSTNETTVNPTVPSGRLVELDLLSGGNSSSQQEVRSLLSPTFHVPDFRAPPRPIQNMTSVTGYATSMSMFLQNPHHHQQEINWGFRPMQQNMLSSSSSSSSLSNLMPPVSYFTRPFQFQAGAGVDIPGPSSDFRVIDPPQRPNSGIWFMLQASQNQTREPFMPQIPKSYLRIKDGRMTVRLVMKYLVNKLRLDSESEIEITCRGQQLLPFLTLQHVRDTIWMTSRDSLTFLQDSSSASDHVMVLHYGRSSQP